MDIRTKKLAELMVNYSVAVKPGDRVLIDGSAAAAPLIKEIFAEVLKAGGNPLLFLDLPGLDEVLYHHASEEQLAYLPEPVRYVMDEYDVFINLIADTNTKSLNEVDPAKLVTRRRARRDLVNRFLQRAAQKKLRWTLTLFPTEAHAQDAEMSLEAYEDFVYNACLPDLNDPVGYWKRFSAGQDYLVDWLKGKKTVHILSEGTDLTLSIEGRQFINCDCHENVPDGEIFTGPVEDSVNGHVYFSYPAIFGGREVAGVRLWFENGKVIKATAEKNEDFLLKTLDTDAGARYLGEFAIGTNTTITRFTRNILFDEKIGGSFHMALGAGYPETGSKNESSLHWDMINDMRTRGEIWVDGELFYQNGKFIVKA